MVEYTKYDETKKPSAFDKYTHVSFAVSTDNERSTARSPLHRDTQEAQIAQLAKDRH